jgi:hypothetical protein
MTLSAFVRRLSIALLLLPAGCAIDPYDMPGTWHAGDTNAANLAAMVVNKHDLIEGQKMTGSDGQLDAAAIDRLRQNKLKPLPATSTQTGASGGGASGGSN